MFKLDNYVAATDEVLPFHFIIDDPAGNSYVKNPFFPNPDPNMQIEKYSRTVEQLEMMGYHPENAEESTAKTDEQKNQIVKNKFEKFSAGEKKKEELLQMAAEMQTHQHNAKYSEKETESILQKAQKINKDKHYSAHKVDFCKPLEEQDLDGTVG